MGIVKRERKDQLDTFTSMGQWSWTADLVFYSYSTKFAKRCGFYKQDSRKIPELVDLLVNIAIRPKSGQK